LPTKGEDLAWDGGRDGIEIIKKFLEEAKNYLERDGMIYIVLSSLCNIEKLKKLFEKKYKFEEVLKQNFFFERLYVYRLTLKLNK